MCNIVHDIVYNNVRASGKKRVKIYEIVYKITYFVLKYSTNIIRYRKLCRTLSYAIRHAAIRACCPSTHEDDEDRSWNRDLGEMIS